MLETKITETARWWFSDEKLDGLKVILLIFLFPIYFPIIIIGVILSLIYQLLVGFKEGE